MAKIDIIMPLYNKAAVVMRGVESIRRQTFADWQLIVVDDGSTDGSGDIVRGIADDRIEVVSQDNAGPGGARNTGIERATSKYIAFLDADDEWLGDYLADSIKALQSHDVSVVANMFYEWPGKINVRGRYARWGVFPGIFSFTGDEDADLASRQICFLHVWNSVMYTETARKYDGFYAEDKCRFAEDTVFFMRILANERFMILERALACHHCEDSGLANIDDHPLPPFVDDPEIVLQYCPAEKRELMKKVIDRMVLRTARRRARHGFKTDAKELLARFDGTKEFGFAYYRCRYEIMMSRWFKYWVWFKCAVGPRTRLFLRKIARKVGLIQDSVRSCDE